MALVWIAFPMVFIKNQEREKKHVKALFFNTWTTQIADVINYCVEVSGWRYLVAFVFGVTILSPWATSFSYPLHTLALKTKLVFPIPINCILPFYCQRKRLPRTNEIRWDTEEKGAVKFVLLASMWPLGSHIGAASESFTETQVSFDFLFSSHGTIGVY